MTPRPELKNGRGPIGRSAAPPVDFLVCFAVKEEAAFFTACRKPPAGEKPGLCVQAWLTGMGRDNAAAEARAAIAHCRPARVITAGFAGGLDPQFHCGDILFDEDAGAGFAARLREQGARPARFHCHDRVAVSAAEKARLWQSSGADAVEMESSVIRSICRELNIPGATVRVISDAARQDLPLDFNALMTRDGRLDFLRLFQTLARHPGRIPALIEFQRQTSGAARRLDAALDALLS
jgi:nucleoside phosphorylase